MPKITITIETGSKAETYKAVTQLGIFAKVTSVEDGDEVWIFDNAEDLKYFQKKNYIRLETGEEITIK